MQILTKENYRSITLKGMDVLQKSWGFFVWIIILCTRFRIIIYKCFITNVEYLEETELLCMQILKKEN